MASDVSDGVEVKCGSKSERRVRALNIPLRPLNSYGSLECPKLSLQQAARDGHEDIVKEWLGQLPRQHQDRVLNAKDDYGFAAFHYAARFNRFKIMQLLNNSGADPAIESREEKLTPLHFAARYIPPYRDEATVQLEAQALLEYLDVTHLSTSRRAVKYLIQTCHVNVNCKDTCGITPLHIACTRNNPAAIEVLLLSSSVDVGICDNNKDTPLHEACLAGCRSVVKMLLEWMESNDKVALNVPNDEKQTPLHLACREGEADIVKLILQYGFNKRRLLVRATDNEGSTPLHLACDSGSEEIVRTLLLNGADICCTKDDEVTPLHLAAEHGFMGIAELLLSSKDDIINVLDVDQRTPLHYAAENNRVEMIEFLLDKGANIEALDNRSYTPLLTATFYGQTEAYRALLERGAEVDVLDKDERSSLFLAAENNHLDTLKAIITNPTGAKLCQATDSSHSTPLHIAAAKGNLEIVEVLLKAGVKITARNELSKTPAHLAAEKGHAQVLREMIAHCPDVVDDEDEDGNTPLHQACISGHVGVARVLIDKDANIEARNAVLWTPMDCAANGGWDLLIDLLLKEEAEVNSTDRFKVTPLHLAAREGHLKVVKILIGNGASVSKSDTNGFNALDLAIENGHKDVAMAIIKGPMWKNALRNLTTTERGGVTTPLRKLIRKMPAVAEEVFNRCTLTNATTDGTIRPDTDAYHVTYDYEFLEDYRDPPSTNFIGRIFHKTVINRSSTESANGDSEMESLLDTGKSKRSEFNSLPLSEWGPVGFKRSNHPLSIMVESERIDLLKHPLVTSLLNYKWMHYGEWFYSISLVVYAIYLAFLTTFALSIHSPLETPCQMVFNARPNSSEANTSSVDCILTTNQTNIIYVSGVIVIILALFKLSVEVFQMAQLGPVYWLSWVNWLELTLFSLSIAFVWVFNTVCLCPYPGQWQIGAIVVFLSWIELIILIQKLPLTGIYVVMFLDIFYTFCRLIALSLLLVIAFGLAFYMCFYDPVFRRTPFSTPALSMVKTITMTNGEYEFDGFFRLVSGGDPNEDPNRDVAFPPVSYFLWIVFIILMPILLTNLLVGLAVDDIKGIQKTAVLKRLALRVELALNVEELFPHQLRRLFIIRTLKVKPNRRLTPWQYFTYRIWGGERFDSSENIATALNPPLDPIKQLQHQNRTLMADVDTMKKSLHELEAIIREMAKKQGIASEEL